MTDAALVAVQLAIDAEVLASAEAYRAHLTAAGDRAADQSGGVGAKLIVFPECAGHLALLAIAPPRAHKAKTLSAALVGAAVRRPLEVLRGVATSRVLHPRHAVLAALAPDGEKFWRAVFGPLARRHAAYVVAGSHLRLGPDGDVTNSSLLFGPDGRCLATTDKVNLVVGVEDGAPGSLGLARGDADAAPLVDTPLGRIATLIGYDASAEPHTPGERFTAMGERVARRGGAAIVANPAAQWRREGLHTSLSASGFARWGVTAQLVGAVLDLTFEGVSQVLACNGATVEVLARAAHHDRADSVAARVTC